MGHNRWSHEQDQRQVNMVGARGYPGEQSSNQVRAMLQRCEQDQILKYLKEVVADCVFKR